MDCVLLSNLHPPSLPPALSAINAGRPRLWRPLTASPTARISECAAEISFSRSEYCTCAQFRRLKRGSCVGARLWTCVSGHRTTIQNRAELAMETDTHPRPAASHPPSHSYTSSVMSSYTYPPEQRQRPEAYRLSPTGSPHGSMEPLSLPPIRSLDPRQQQPPYSSHQQPHPPSGPGVGPPMPPTLSPMPHKGPYYGGSAAQPPPVASHMGLNVTSSPQTLRFPIPAVGDPNRMISGGGGRHKKEVKRRTKTGCLTCRKRRIKVSQRHKNKWEKCCVVMRLPSTKRVALRVYSLAPEGSRLSQKFDFQRPTPPSPLLSQS